MKKMILILVLVIVIIGCEEIEVIKEDLKEGFKNAKLRGGEDNPLEELEREKPLEIIEEEIEKEDIEEKSKEESLLFKCESDFDYYADISKRKYNVRISIIEEEIVNDRESIDKFSEIWGYNTDVGCSETVSILCSYKYLPELEYPVVLFAVKFEGVPEGQLPIVIACNNEGKIMEKSRKTLLDFGGLLALGD